ncbi:glycosyltransferase [Alloscardovia venturai]|uniref:Glycosyltransferase n=1 Tax=Alloscardovia venturai TaxID=1769421 RepID=A0ABW2Y3W8_9BIFI
MVEHLSIHDYFSHITDTIGSVDTVDVEFVIPIYNEERDLAHAVTAVYGFLSGERDSAGTTVHETHKADFTWRIVITDNASTDSTWDIACTLAQKFPHRVRAIRVDRKGRGFALKTAWLSSNAQHTWMLIYRQALTTLTILYILSSLA